MIVERQTVSISDDTGRIAMLEQRTYGDPADDHYTDEQLVRYVYSNHLQSASLELDERGEIISYEEYHPYGTTSYQANNADVQACAKRYRYTGKERDEESGLYYHGARYYVSWLGRWSASDPLESKYAGMSPYNYSFNNPVMWSDPSGMGPEDALQGFSAFSAVSTADNTSVYQRPQVDQISLTPATGPFADYVNSLPLDQRLEMQYNASNYEQNVLMADIYGNGHVGSELDVLSILETIRQERSNQTAENIRGGIFGSAGYLAGGERGSDIGASFDQIALGLEIRPGMGKMRLKPELRTAEERPGVRMEERPVEKLKFEREGYSYFPKISKSPEGITIIHRLQKNMVNTDPILVGYSTISPDATLTNMFEVPVDLQRKGISKAMYRKLNSIGFKTIDASYNPTSDNYKAFMSIYDPFKGNSLEAVMATPAAKAMGENFYPSNINVRSVENKVTNISVIWSRKNN